MELAVKSNGLLASICLEPLRTNYRHIPGYDYDLPNV